jgi:membrane-bound ClpP family serine protease
MKIRLREIPRHVYFRYGLLAISGTAVLVLILIVVQFWLPVPLWLRVTLILLWILKEIFLFPLVWRAYDSGATELTRPMVGLKGVTKERLAPTGYILIQGELWKAEKMNNEPPIEKDRRVRVEKIDGLKLFVVTDCLDDRSQSTDDRRQTTECR